MIYILTILLLCLPFISWSDEGIHDNSFLLDEAYLQEADSFQFTQRYQLDNQNGDNEYELELELPFRRDMFFSFELPYSQSKEWKAVGDGSANLHWQSLDKNGLLAIETFGLILPYGAVKKDTGHGTYGLALIHVFTMPLGTRWFNHWNAGVNFIPAAKSPDTNKKYSLTEFEVATSLVYVINDKLHLLFEAVIKSGQTFEEESKRISENFYTFNPGFRFGLERWAEWIIVPGLSFPITRTDGEEETNFGTFLYFSIESEP